MKTISVVIPVFNSSPSLHKLHIELSRAITDIADDYEILLIDDRSHDNSWEIIENITEQDSRVKGIRLSRNYGQHNALLCGIRAAKYEIIVTMDDDLQNPPTEIPKLVQKLDDGVDVVYGTPQTRTHGFLRNLASRLTGLALQNIMGIEAARDICSFRAFKSQLRDGFAQYSSPYVSIDVLLTWSTANFTSIKVKHEPREAGKSNYSIGKLIIHAFTVFTGFSTLPLRLASFVGFIFTIFGTILFFWVISRYFIYGTSVPGFPFLASIVVIFSGVQLFALGIFGEYLARIHLRTMERPPYVVSEQQSQNENGSLI